MATGSTTISVIIPAHNEQHALGRCLAAIFGDGPGDLDVIVVCNGCSDKTSQVARSFDPLVRVIEQTEASKTRALNAGDASATAFPRFYVDADVEVTGSALRHMADVLRREDLQACSPKPEIVLAGCSWLVRSFYRIWRRLPQLDGCLMGAGVYAVSEAGRRRFTWFPDVVADDLYVNDLYLPGERRRIETATSLVRPAASLGDLVRTRTRVQLGNQQLRHRGHRASAARVPGWIHVVRREPRLAPDLVAYLGVSAVAKLGAAYRISRGNATWTRAERIGDETSSESATSLSP